MKLTEKKIDIVLLILFPLFAFFIAIFLKANYLTSILLFFAPPAVYLSYRTKKAILRTLLFSILFVLPFGLVSDYVGIYGGAWACPSKRVSCQTVQSNSNRRFNRRVPVGIYGINVL